MTAKNFKEYRNEHNGVTWKQYVDLRFQETEKALSLAAKEMNRRLEGMNELRSQLDKQASTFITRDTFEAYKDAVGTKINALDIAASEKAGRIGAYHVLITTAIALIVGLSVYFLTGR